MKYPMILALAAAFLAAPALSATPAKAGSVGFSIHKPGFSLHIGKYPRYYRRHYYKRYRYRRHYGPRIYLRKRYYRKRYHRSRRGGRCSYWSRKCARNWGYGGSNYRGCLRYHNCR